MCVTVSQDAAQAQGERGASVGALIAGDRVHRSSTSRPWVEVVGRVGELVRVDYADAALGQHVCWCTVQWDDRPEPQKEMLDGLQRWDDPLPTANAETLQSQPSHRAVAGGASAAAASSSSDDDIS